MPRPGPNHAMQRTAGSLDSSISMKFHPQPAATPPAIADLVLVRRMKALAAILFIVASTSVHAQRITGAEVVEYGILKKIKSEGLLEAPNTLTGKVNNVIVEQLVQTTTTI